jgi:hypothetical protein
VVSLREQSNTGLSGYVLCLRQRYHGCCWSRPRRRKSCPQPRPHAPFAGQEFRTIPSAGLRRAHGRRLLNLRHAPRSIFRMPRKRSRCRTSICRPGRMTIERPVGLA